MKRLSLTLFLLLFSKLVLATHNRAGEITYRWISGLTYEVTISTYTRDSAPADRCELEISWGDGTTNILKRSNGFSSPNPCQSVGAQPGEPIGNDVRLNIYKGTHTYATSGSYVLSFEDPNRNAGVSNIIQSISVPFYVQSLLTISPGLGGNSSPILDNPPIDDGCINQIFEHNAGAFDADGDSLSYRLVPCRTAGGAFINTTYDPNYVQDSVFIDPRTGDLIWDVPKNVGQFNFAFEISEWRKDGNGKFVKIGYVVRDMQVNIDQCVEINRPPVIPDVGPFCVEAGQNLNFTIQATDPDNDPVALRAYGGPYLVTNPANPLATIGSNPVFGTFNWNTRCSHVRKQPYYLTIEAKDNPAGRSTNLPQLVSLSTIEIVVVAPAPQNPMAQSNNDAIDLSWDPSICLGANGYQIYRRESTYGFIPSECETGVPEYTGYELLDTISGVNTTNYSDTNDLKRGVEYCYMVVAGFPDGSESYASIEFCTSLSLTMPMMTNADVQRTDSINGSIFVSWIYPPVLDSFQFPPPYSFKLYRAEGLSGTNFAEVYSGTDTSFVDSGLNTSIRAYRYLVEMYSGASANLLGQADAAASPFISITPGDGSNLISVQENVPWRNNSFVIFRETPQGSGNFSIIDTSYLASYRDTGLENGEEYCYKVLTTGAYTASDSLPAPLLNNSQELCSAPIDTSSPCPPLLDGTFYCEQDSLYLEWDYPMDSTCSQDVVEYRLYHRANSEAEFQLYAQFPATDDHFISITEPPVIGCYAITAVDDANNDINGIANESDFSLIICANPCPDISFPNVFTPNADGVNDFFTAIDYRNIGDLHMQIYNRWGVLVYETTDPKQFLEEGWNGTDMNSGEECSNGVYYYICQYTPESLGTPITREATGFLHLFRD